MIRELILDIMCHFKGNLSGLKAEDLAKNLTSLEEMERDRLVKIKEKEIEVTKKGRPYVRNICMAFDKRLMQKQPDTQIFSMTV